MADLKDKFVAWGKQHAIPLNPDAELDDFSDLQPVKDLIGDARVVNVGESNHYTREFVRFRSRFFQFLVKEMGFKVFALEVGLVEGKIVSDYVDLKHDDAQLAYLNVNQTFGFWAEQQEMLEWMRAYNAEQPPEERVRFYGIDGSQCWNHAGTAVEAVCDYIDRVDPDYGRELHQDLLPLSQRVTLTTVKDGSADDDIVAFNYGLTKLVGRMLSERDDYAERSSKDDFAWGLKFAEVAQWTAATLAQVHDRPDHYASSWNNMRDYYMACQFKWVLDREAPDTRIFCGAYNMHLQTYPILAEDLPLSPMGQAFKDMIPEGTMVNIAATANYSVKAGDASTPDSNQGAMAEIGLESFLLDLRPAEKNPEVYEWLSEQRPDRLAINYQPLVLAEAFDAVYYIDRISIDELRLPAALKVDTISLGEDDLEAVTGKYVFHGGGWTEELYIIREGAKLYSDVGEDCDDFFPMYKSELFAASKTEFRWREWPMELTFELGEDGIARGLTVKVGGMDDFIHADKE